MSVSRARRPRAPPSSVPGRGEGTKGQLTVQRGCRKPPGRRRGPASSRDADTSPSAPEDPATHGGPTVVPDKRLPSTQGASRGPGVKPCVGARPPGSLEDGFASQNKLMRAGPTLPGARGAVWTVPWQPTGDPSGGKRCGQSHTELFAPSTAPPSERTDRRPALRNGDTRPDFRV